MLHLIRDRSFGALTLTQFLGAFNDNAFKQLVLLLAVLGTADAPPAWIADSALAGHGQALPAMLFALPFVLLGALTGSLADRLSKTTIIRAANLLEVAVMALGALCFWLRSYDGLMAVIFLMGAQSALFGPSKYGSIVELVGRPMLSQANALIQMTTMLAILGGAMLGGVLLDSTSNELWRSGDTFVGIAFVGWLVSLRIRALPPKDPARHVHWNVFAELRDHWRATGGDRPLVLSLIASSFFYLVGATLLLVVNAYGKSLGLDGTATSMLNAMTVVGIAVGSLAAGRISGERIEPGLIPLGLGGMAVCLFLVQLAPTSIGLLRGALFGLGVSAGLFSIPIRALIQILPKADHRGSILGLSEVLDFVGILAASGAFFLFESVFELTPPSMFTTLGVAVSVFVVGSLCYTAEFLLRLFLLAFTRFAYRLRVSGLEHLPSDGGALIVANHVSYVDAILIGAASPRPVRFLAHASLFELRFVGAFMRRVGALPVGGSDRDETRRSIETAAAAAREGELVCIFAEGGITRCGSLMPFARGLERIARAAGVPIVPLALDRLWGSVFSFEGGRAFFKRPRRLPYSVDLCVGEPLAPDTPAWRVRDAISELVTDVRSRRSGRRGSLAWRLLYHARRQGGRPAVLDASGTDLSYRKLLQASLALARVARRRLEPAPAVAVMLPPGAGAVLATTALALEGRPVIHLNSTLETATLRRLLERAGVRQVITSRRFLKLARTSSPLPEEQTIQIEDWLRSTTGADKAVAFAWSLLPAAALAHLRAWRRDADELATIVYSSGSTGEPKGVELTSGAILSNVQAFLQVVPFGPGDALLGILPFFHSFGYTVTLWSVLLSGARGLYHPNPFDAAGIARLARDEGASLLIATPTIYRTLLRRCTREDFPRLRLCASGAEKLRPELAEAWRERFGLELLEGYGATELGPVVSFNLPPDDRAEANGETRRPGSVGRPLPGVTLRIADVETGEPLGPGAEGLLWVKSPARLRAYHGDPARTAEVLRDGWYCTGDIARVDIDGFLMLTDRLARFSKIGGEMVPHGLVEETLVRVAIELGGGTADELELCVTSIEDERKGERLVVVHTSLGVAVDAIVARAAMSDLPALFVPRAASFVEVDALPSLGSGKTDFRRLREIAHERLAGE